MADVKCNPGVAAAQTLRQVLGRTISYILERNKIIHFKSDKINLNQFNLICRHSSFILNKSCPKYRTRSASRTSPRDLGTPYSRKRRPVRRGCPDAGPPRDSTSRFRWRPPRARRSFRGLKKVRRSSGGVSVGDWDVFWPGGLQGICGSKSISERRSLILHVKLSWKN